MGGERSGKVKNAKFGLLSSSDHVTNYNLGFKQVHTNIVKHDIQENERKQ
jgi:hypothetical protein